MKVLQICAYAARYGGNFLASLRRLEKRLAQQGIQTEYLFPEAAREMPWCKALCAEVTVHFAGSNRFSPATYRQVAAAMAQADIVHSHFELYDCLAAMAKKKGQKLFWHLHDSFDEQIDLPHRVINKIQYGVLGKKAVLISPSRYYADYVQKLGFPEKQIYCVPNGVDFSRLGSVGAEEKHWDFLVFGGFYYIKGLDVLMDSCRLLKQRGMDFRLGVVGYPDTWKYLDESYPDLQTLVERLEPKEDVSSFYQSAKTYLCTSRRECFSYALLEALYMGLPAIISDIPGNTWAKDFESTEVFSSGDSAALAEAMARRLSGEFDPQTQATAQAVARCYSAESWAGRIEEIYFGT